MSVDCPFRLLQENAHWCTGSMRVCLPKRQIFCSFFGFLGELVTSLSKVPNLSCSPQHAAKPEVSKWCCWDVLQRML